MTCDTAGGSGVGPAVIRYCLTSGFGMGRVTIANGPERAGARPASGDQRSDDQDGRARVAVEVGEDQGERPADRRERRSDDPDDPDDVPGLRETFVLLR